MNIAPIPSMPETSAPPVNPPLKWAGGKRWCPYLRPLWRQHAWRRLVEPSRRPAVSLERRPQTALLNDANPHLINFYTWLQEGLTVNLPMANWPWPCSAHVTSGPGLLAAAHSRGRGRPFLWKSLAKPDAAGLRIWHPDRRPRPGPRSARSCRACLGCLHRRDVQHHLHHAGPGHRPQPGRFRRTRQPWSPVSCRQRLTVAAQATRHHA